MVIKQCDKIDIARILIERIDGVVAQARVSTLALANTVLERWASDAPGKVKASARFRSRLFLKMASSIVAASVGNARKSVFRWPSTFVRTW